MLAPVMLAACVSGGSDAPETRVDNSSPAASAGVDFTVFNATQATLNGSATTDADGDPLTYSWAFDSRPSGSNAAITGANTAAPGFVPDIVGVYVVRLSVTDGFGGSSSDTVTVTSATPPPVAEAGPDQDLTYSAPGISTQLDGGGSSDPSGLVLTYQWVIEGFVPESGLPPAQQATLGGAGTALATLSINAADQLGTYTVRLTVNNGVLDASDQVEVRVASVPSPLANAGPDQQVSYVAGGKVVSLDGSGSSDPSSLPLSYSWTVVSFTPEDSNVPPVPTITLIGANTATPTFDLASGDQRGDYVIALTVNNGTLQNMDQVVISVAKSFPGAGVLLSANLFALAATALRRRMRKWAAGRRKPGYLP